MILSVSALLEDMLSPGMIGVWRAVAQGLLWGADENQKEVVPVYSVVLWDLGRSHWYQVLEK